MFWVLVFVVRKWGCCYMFFGVVMRKRREGVNRDVVY